MIGDGSWIRSRRPALAGTVRTGAAIDSTPCPGSPSGALPAAAAFQPHPTWQVPRGDGRRLHKFPPSRLAPQVAAVGKRAARLFVQQ